MKLAEIEKRAILDAVDKAKGDKLLAADKLGIGKTTLYRKLKEYGRGARKSSGRGRKKK
jgi:two-component system response regulator HydG